MNKFPYGWFLVTTLNDLVENKFINFRSFGIELMARYYDGECVVHSAICPHQGAHLGKSITPENIISSDRVRCPYHAWEFDMEGKVVDIPYCKMDYSTLPSLKVYKTDIVDGIVYMWYPGDNNEHPEPEYFIEPVLFGDTKIVNSIRTEMHNDMRLTLDNFIDVAHLPGTHGIKLSNEKWRVEFEDYKVHCYIKDDHFDIYSAATGMGYQVADAMHMNSRQILAIRPIDENITEAIMYFFDTGLDGRKLSQKEMDFSLTVMQRIVDEDKEVLANRQWLDDPCPVAGDGPTHKMRKWFNQFYR